MTSSTMHIAALFALITLIHAASSTRQESNAGSLKISPMDRQTTATQISDLDQCNLTVSTKSLDYFKSKLYMNDPHLIHFKITFPPHHPTKSTKQTFKPDQWVWTYKSSNGLLPYLYWNIDYSILSFGLLDAKTLPMNDMWIQIDVPPTCTSNITFGTTNTTYAIARALTGMIATLVKDSSEYLTYESSFFCYLAENPEYETHDTITYLAAVYFLYPISYINYNCCKSVHSYVKNIFNTSCNIQQIEKWSQCTIGPYVLGIIIFLYFPIWIFQIASWIASDEEVVSSEYEMIDPSFVETRDRGGHHNRSKDGWVYLDGESPHTFIDLLSHVWCGLNTTWPTAVSRVRRLVVLVLTPLGVYIHIYIYHQYFFENTKLLLKHKTPMGFLSFLGDDPVKQKTFVPILGGPKGLAILYFSVGLLFLVVPRSLKQVFEDGMPTQGSRFRSPLCLSVRDIKRHAMVGGSLEPGYVKGLTMFKCGFIMLFSKEFWKHVFMVQFERVFENGRNSPVNAISILKIIALPLYVVLCLSEILLCILLYGVPLCMFTVVVIRGSTRSLSSFRMYLARQFTNGSTLNQVIFNNRIIRLLTCIFIASLILVYSYANSLVFIETFQFLSQIIVFCFVAVIVFPSVSFGYLFFSIVLCYYIVRRIRDFGDSYLELLADVVEVSRNLDDQPNYITFIDDVMMVKNVKMRPGIKTIQINDKTIKVNQGDLDPTVSDTSERPKIKLVDSVYAVPRDFFTYIVRKHRPAHQQLLKLAFNLLMICVLLYMTMSISRKYVSGPSSEISEVMHVIFIVAIGALPHVLEVALSGPNKPVMKEIELRKLEKSIASFWRDENENTSKSD